MAITDAVRQRLGRMVGLTAYNTTNSDLDAVHSTSNALHSHLATLIAGERNQDSSTNSYLDTRKVVTPVVLTSISAVDIGGSTAANDTHLMGIIILANGTAVTAAVAGFGNESGTAKTVTFTGSTTADVFVNLSGLALLNTKAKLSVTASVADKVVVLYRAA